MIYFIRSGQYVKIGVSARPWERLAEFQTANPEPLEMLAVGPGDYGFESELHRLFGEHRRAGEWFRGTERIMDVVRFMRQTFPELQERPQVITPTTPGPDEREVQAARDDDEWRIERRSYTRRDGTISVYQNYRRRHIEYDADGRRRIAYRTAKQAASEEDYEPDSLPSGPRTFEELAVMPTRTWRIETNAAGGGGAVWGWRRRGATREYRYGGVVISGDGGRV